VAHGLGGFVRGAMASAYGHKLNGHRDAARRDERRHRILALGAAAVLGLGFGFRFRV